MRLYKTSGTGAHRIVACSWSATQDDARRARRTLQATCDDVRTVPVDVPTDKAGLLAWLNENWIDLGLDRLEDDEADELPQRASKRSAEFARRWFAEQERRMTLLRQRAEAAVRG